MATTETSKIKRIVDTYSNILTQMSVPQIAFTNDTVVSPELSPGTPVILEGSTFHALAAQFDIDQATSIATPADNSFGALTLHSKAKYIPASLPTMDSDEDLVYLKHLQDNYRLIATSIITVDVNGLGDYTTIQAALDANTSGGEMFIVNPGTYSGDTVYFTANNQVVSGYDSSPEVCIVTQTSTNVVDDASFTGCFLANMAFSITGATTAVSVVKASGELSMFRCNINMTTAFSTTGGLQPTDVDGAGTMVFDFCNFNYTHTGDIGTDTKYHGLYAEGLSVTYRHCSILMTCSCNAGLTTSGFGDSPDVDIVFNDNSLIINDADATIVAAALFGGNDDVYYSRNLMQITCGNGKTAICGYVSGTPTLRGYNNTMIAVAPGGSAYVYSTSVGSTVYSIGENIVAADGYTGTGIMSMFSTVNGDTFRVTETLEADAIDVLDSGFRVRDSSDTTKEVALECSGITTATTRTLTALDVSGDITTGVTVPVSATASGVAGSIAYESGTLYICIATDTWEKTTIATW